MYDARTIGPRLRTLRKWRGMSLVGLSGQAGMSKSTLSDIERGLSALDRRSWIANLATVLRVSETDIVGGPHLSNDPIQAEPHAAVPAIRVALQTNTLTDAATDQARPLEALLIATRELEEIFTRCDYITLGVQLPSVLDELHVHVAQPRDEAAQRAALAALVEACMYATFRMKDLGYLDLASQAAARAEEAAQLLEDPVTLGKAAYCRIQSMPREGGWDRKLLSARKAVNKLQPHADSVTGTSVLGMLVLSSALAAAVDHKHDEARDWLTEARDLASRVPDEPRSNWSNFCTVNVGVWDVAIAVEGGEAGGGVLEKARIVDQNTLSGAQSRYASFLADVGRGLGRERKMAEQALAWLLQAETVAPQRIRNSTQVRETVAVMMEQGKVSAVGRELRGLAARMGVPH